MADSEKNDLKLDEDQSMKDDIQELKIYSTDC